MSDGYSADMSVSHLEVVRRLAAELAAADTLFVSEAGPQLPSACDEAGPATWWSDLAGALANQQGNVPATRVENPASVQRSGIPSEFDLLVVDPAALTDTASVADLLTAVSTTAKFVAILEPVGAGSPTEAQRELLTVASGTGFELDSGTVLDRTGLATLLVPNYGRREGASGHVEAVTTGHGIAATSRCEDPECQRRVSMAERQAMVDRDRVLGVLARSLQIQYDLDHQRIALARTQRQLAATERKLEASRKQLRRLRRSRKYRLANAMSNPVATMKARRGKKPDAPASPGTKGIGS